MLNLVHLWKFTYTHDTHMNIIEPAMAQVTDSLVKWKRRRNKQEEEKKEAPAELICQECSLIFHSQVLSFSYTSMHIRCFKSARSSSSSSSRTPFPLKFSSFHLQVYNSYSIYSSAQVSGHPKLTRVHIFFFYLLYFLPSFSCLKHTLQMKNIN